MADASDAQREPLTNLERKFQTLQTRDSLKFSWLYLFCLAVYIAVYQLVRVEWNDVPLLCAGINVFFAICAIGCHLCKCAWQAPVIVHSLGLLVVCILSGIANAEVQRNLLQHTAVLQAFGPPPSCTHILANGRCSSPKDAYENICVLQLVMTYHVLFLLRFRTALISSIPGIILYGVVTWSFGERYSPYMYAVFLAQSIISLIAKFAVESSQRHLFYEVNVQRANALEQKVLRCQAEFRSECLQEKGSATNAQKGDGTQSNKSDTALSSAVCFISIDEDDEPQNILQRIRAIGHQEHWLLDTSSIRVCRNQILGSGGFGVVMKGNFGRTSVALKLSNAQYYGKREHRNLVSIVHELRILRRLRHPNIVLFHGASIDFSSSQLVLVIEFVAGETLESWIQDQSAGREIEIGRVPKTESAKQIVLLGVSSALSYLHGHNPCIVHGDIKASNIMIEGLAKEPRAKLLDFGLSRLITPNARCLGGTLRWMAPEVVKGPCHPTSASDVFSFGRLIYFVATERMPFAEYGNNKQKLRNVLKMRHSPSLVWPNTNSTSFDEGCRLVGETCMQAKPELRPQIFGVHDDIIGWSPLSSRAGDAAGEHDVGDSIGLCEFLQKMSKQKPCTPQIESPGNQAKSPPGGHEGLCEIEHPGSQAKSPPGGPTSNLRPPVALPRIPEDNICDEVAASVNIGGAVAHNDLEGRRLKPTPLASKVVALVEVMASWHDESNSTVCCPWHNSLQRLEEMISSLGCRCVHHWGESAFKYQCPQCLMITDPEAGVCAFCTFKFQSFATQPIGVDDSNDVGQIESPIEVKVTL